MIRLLVTILCTTCAMAFSQVPPKTNANLNETKEIEMFLHAYDTAWNNHMPSQLASLWDESGDLMTPWGRWVMGKPQVEKYFDIINTPPYAKSKLQQSIDYVRHITSNLAIVDTSLTITGLEDPNIDKSRPFLLHSIYIMGKVGNQWKIISNRSYIFNDKPIGN